jgi:hypothetical protein
MTWQEDLRQLDARLANGDIGAADYRRTRDEILAEASSGNQANGTESPKDGLWTSTNPSAQDEKTTETPAPGETTVVVRVDAPEEEKTQIVTADQLEQPTRPVGPASPPPQPWAGPAPGQFQQRPAPIQGQEVFANASSGGSGKWLRWVVPLVIVALIGAGVWWFVFRDDSTQPQAENPPPSSNTSQTEEPEEPAAPSIDELASTVPTLPGETKADSGPVTTAEALQLGLLNDAYATLLQDNGVSELVYQKSTQDRLGYQVAAAPVEEPGNAVALTELMTAYLQEAGFAAATPAESAGLPVITRTDQFFRTFVVTYASGGVWVQLNVSGPPDGDEAALRAEFETVLTGLTERLPAD